MSESGESNDISNVNETVGEEWEAETTPYERVREVVSHTYQFRSADAIASDARTSPKTARKHLTKLSDEGFVTTGTGETGGTTYRRSPESLVLEQAADILEELTVDELASQITKLRDQLSALQSEYGVESPEELTVAQTNELLSETGGSHTDIDHETLRRWRTTRRNLAFANAALSVANAEQFVDGDTHRNSGTAVSQ